MAGGFEILEHTADVGIRSWGATPEEAVEQAGWALLHVLGARVDPPGTIRNVVATGTDLGGALVDFLNQLILLHETEESGFAAVRVKAATGDRLEGEVEMVPLAHPPRGVPVKAATFHQLHVEHRRNGQTEARVYLDV